MLIYGRCFVWNIVVCDKKVNKKEKTLGKILAKWVEI